MSIAFTTTKVTAPIIAHPGRWARDLRWAALGLSLGLVLLLGGCASVIRLENDVQSYARWPDRTTPQAGDTFRLERLPSQLQAGGEQARLEAQVSARLTAAGLKAAPAGAEVPVRWLAEVSARSLRLPHAPWESPRDRWPGPGLAGRDYVVTANGRLVAVPIFMNITPPYYQREVSVLLRDARTGSVAYESRAAHDGPWHDNPSLWDALVRAALDGFPQPPSGPRRVVIEVPR